jgi:Protein of unknown function (DUF3562)
MSLSATPAAAQQKVKRYRMGLREPNWIQPLIDVNAHTPLPQADDATVRALAEQTRCDAGEVKSLMDREIARLCNTASVTTFIPLIARRRVKQQLLTRRRRAN